MSKRGTETRSAILQAAKELFMEKGFTAVTMSDLCQATGLSRGGLYRHFASVKDVFVALLTNDKDDWQEKTKQAIDAGISAAAMIFHYSEQVYEGILNGEGRLSLAIYEYARTEQDSEGFLRERYEEAVSMMECLLRHGQRRGEFGEFDPRVQAEQMVIFTDGLKMAAAGIGLSPEMVRGQLAHLLRGLK